MLDENVYSLRCTETTDTYDDKRIFMKLHVSLANLCNFKIIFSFQCLHSPKDKLNQLHFVLYITKNRQPCNQTTDTYNTYAPALIHELTKYFKKCCMKNYVGIIFDMYSFLFRKVFFYHFEYIFVVR